MVKNGLAKQRKKIDLALTPKERELLLGFLVMDRELEDRCERFRPRKPMSVLPRTNWYTCTAGSITRPTSRAMRRCSGSSTTSATGHNG